MLDSLHIENIALIKELDVDFSCGFTVFTGETGAGKSIIIDSIRLILGAKADKRLIRSGENEAYVCAIFSDIGNEILIKLKELDIAPDEDGNIIISRYITLDGKSRAKIGKKAVSSSALREIGDQLIAIHGQHDSMKLLDTQSHLGFLDRYACIGELKSEYLSVFNEMNSVKNKLKTEANFIKENAHRIPVMKSALAEINDANIKEGEEQKLDERRALLRGSAKIFKNVSAIERTIKGADNVPGAIDLIRLAEGSLMKISDSIESSGELLERLRSVSAELEGICDDISAYCDISDSDDPEQAIAKIDERLSVIDRLTKKYGDLNEYKSNALETFRRVSKSGELCEQYKETLAKLSERAFLLADEMTQKRKKAGEDFSKKVLEELAFLDLPKVRFEVEITKQLLPSGNVRLSSEGCDNVRFLISPNVGEDMKELAKIASGGEISRIMLALCCVFADKYGIESMIFDEIDTGISGKTSEKIGIKLRESAISGRAQVFCVTHSAQVASCADSHIKIAKGEQDGRTVTRLTKLSDDERVEELSRIMGGIEITDSIRRSAREMIEKNKKTNND